MIKISTPLSTVDSSAAYSLGTRTYDKFGNEFIYAAGIASVAKYDWCTLASGGTINASYETSTGTALQATRLTSAGTGRVGIAQATIIANKYGWFGIYGNLIGNTGIAGSISAGTILYASGTTATVTQVAAIGTQILGAITTYASTTGDSGTVQVSLNYPSLNGIVV